MFIRTPAAIGLALAASTVSAQSLFDFNSLVHGEIITNQFEADGLTISVTNPNRSHDIAAGFDTQFAGSTSDDDLIGPPWAGGNLAVSSTSVVLSSALIISENDTDSDMNGILDNPDDEGSRPAGTLTLSFGGPRAFFGLDVVDLEGVIQEATALQFTRDGSLVGEVSFDEFVDVSSVFFDPTVEFGDNHANRIAPITTADLFAAGFTDALDGFDSVTIVAGGSGAWDNVFISQVIPTPGTAVLGLMGLATMARRRR